MYGNKLDNNGGPEAKAAFEMNAKPADSGICGRPFRTVSLSPEEPCRVGIRERVENDLNRAAREAGKLERLQELSFLLQKNPDIARILDLMDIVRG